MVDIQESVRGKDVYILQTAATNVNDVIMELLIMAYACKTSNCKNIIGTVLSRRLISSMCHNFVV
jgi:phosphoribosylpyrophosphate synthetase